MVNTRRAEAAWDGTRQLWVIRVQKSGIRKAFYSAEKGRKGKREAEAKADKWLSAGTAVMRFSAAWEAYLKAVKANTGTGNYKNVDKVGRLYLLPHLGFKKLSAITRNDWQSCITAMASRLSERTCKNAISTISAFLVHADGEGWEFTPIKKRLTIPAAAKPAREKQVLQPPELKILFTASEMPFRGVVCPAYYIHAWRFYVATGLRRGELAGLRREDVGSTLSIRRNINNLKEETHGKTSNARRTMQITSLAQKILRDQAAMLEEMGIESDWVFPDKYGDRSDPNLIYKHWVRYRAHHGIACSIHELRHTFISINKVDMPLELLKSLVGHSASMDTIGVYGHEIDGEKERAARYVDDAFSKLLQ